MRSTAPASLSIESNDVRDRIMRALDAVTKGGTRKPQNNILVLPWVYYHRQAFLDNVNTYQFFNVSGNDFTTNWQQSGQLPGTNGFALRSVHCWIDSGYDLTGAKDATGSEFAATANPGQVAEDLRIAHEMYRFDFTIGTRKVVEVPSLTFLPKGNGLDVRPAVANSNAATVNTFAFANNGAPADVHRDQFPGLWPIEPGESVNAKAYAPSNIAVQGASAVICCAIKGLLVIEAR